MSSSILSQLPDDILLYISRFSGLVDNVSFSMVDVPYAERRIYSCLLRFASKCTLYQHIGHFGSMV